MHGILVLEYSNHTAALNVEICPVNQIGFWLDAEIMIRGELNLEWAYQLVKIWASCVHVAEVSLFTIYWGNLILPQVSQELKVFFRYVDVILFWWKHCQLCRAPEKTHVAVSCVLQFYSPAVLKRIIQRIPVNSITFFFRALSNIRLVNPSNWYGVVIVIEEHSKYSLILW